VRGTGNCLNGQALGLVISGTMSNWTSVASSVPQGLVLGPETSSLMIWTECIFSNFADDMKLGRVAHAPDECPAIERNLDRLENWMERKVVKFSKEKCIWGAVAVGISRCWGPSN